MTTDERYEAAFREYNGLYRLSNEIYHDIAVGIGLSDSAFDILYYLNELGQGCLQKDLCDVTYLPKQTVNSSLQKMVREGLLRLEVEHGRSTCVFATEKGQAFIAEHIQPVVEAERAALREMTSAEADQLLKLTKRYLEHLAQKAQALVQPEVR